MLLGNDYRNDAVEKLYGDRVGNSSIIFTPWDTVEDMLDLIPEDFWTPDVTILDMYCKSGRFLVGAFRKLYNSPYLAYLSEGERTLHILNKQLFGLCSDMTCMLLAEANLYGYAQYGKKHIKLVGTYDYDSLVKQRKDDIINRTVERKFGQMKFDLVIGNPPYNNDAYIDFVEIGHKLATQYSCWVTPAKWQAKGGEKNEQFRKDIVPHMSKIVYYPDCCEVFNIGEAGGISYYLVDKINEHNDKTLDTKCRENKLLENNNNTYNYKCLDNYAYSILDKVNKYKKLYVEPLQIIDDNSYVLMNNLVGTTSGHGGDTCLFSKSEYKTPFISRPKITHEKPDSNHWLIYKGTDEQCKSFISYLDTKFIRFLAYLGKCGNSVRNEETWRFVPDPITFDHIFTDEELYKKYNLTPEEINIIESVIKERK